MNEDESTKIDPQKVRELLEDCKARSEHRAKKCEELWPKVINVDHFIHFCWWYRVNYKELARVHELMLLLLDRIETLEEKLNGRGESDGISDEKCRRGEGISPENPCSGRGDV